MGSNERRHPVRTRVRHPDQDSSPNSDRSHDQHHEYGGEGGGGGNEPGSLAAFVARLCHACHENETNRHETTETDSRLRQEQRRRGPNRATVNPHSLLVSDVARVKTNLFIHHIAIIQASSSNLLLSRASMKQNLGSNSERKLKGWGRVKNLGLRSKCREGSLQNKSV